MVRGEGGDLLPPTRMIAAGAVHEHQRGPGAVALVIEFRAVDGEERHGRPRARGQVSASRCAAPCWKSMPFFSTMPAERTRYHSGCAGACGGFPSRSSRAFFSISRRYATIAASLEASVSLLRST